MLTSWIFVNFDYTDKNFFGRNLFNTNWLIHFIHWNSPLYSVSVLEQPSLNRLLCMTRTSHSECSLFFISAHFEQFGPPTLLFWDRPLSVFEIIYFHPFGFSDHPLFDFRTVHFRKLNTFSLLDQSDIWLSTLSHFSDRSVFDSSAVHFADWTRLVFWTI